MFSIRDSFNGGVSEIPLTSNLEKSGAIKSAITGIYRDFFVQRHTDILKIQLDVHTFYKYRYAHQNFEFRRVRYNNCPISIQYVFEGKSCEHHVGILNNVITLIPVSWFEK